MKALKAWLLRLLFWRKKEQEPDRIVFGQIMCPCGCKSVAPGLFIRCAGSAKLHVIHLNRRSYETLHVVSNS